MSVTVIPLGCVRTFLIINIAKYNCGGTKLTISHGVGAC